MDDAAAPVVHVRITSNGKTRNYIAFVAETFTAALADSENKTVVLTAVGKSAAKAITVAEVVKTLVPGLNQLNELSEIVAKEGDDDDAAAIETDKPRPSAFKMTQLTISLSLQTLGSAAHYGYQPALTPMDTAAVATS